MAMIVGESLSKWSAVTVGNATSRLQLKPISPSFDLADVT